MQAQAAPHLHTHYTPSHTAQAQAGAHCIHRRSTSPPRLLGSARRQAAAAAGTSCTPATRGGAGACSAGSASARNARAALGDVPRASVSPAIVKAEAEEAATTLRHTNTAVEPSAALLRTPARTRSRSHRRPHPGCIRFRTQAARRQWAATAAGEHIEDGARGVRHGVRDCAVAEDLPREEAAGQKYGVVDGDGARNTHHTCSAAAVETAEAHIRYSRILVQVPELMRAAAVGAGDAEEEAERSSEIAEDDAHTGRAAVEEQEEAKTALGLTHLVQEQPLAGYKKDTAGEGGEHGAVGGEAQSSGEEVRSDVTEAREGRSGMEQAREQSSGGRRVKAQEEVPRRHNVDALPQEEPEWARTGVAGALRCGGQAPGP